MMHCSTPYFPLQLLIRVVALQSGLGGADGERVGVPREECGAPSIPHESQFRVAILRGLGVVEDAVNKIKASTRIASRTI